MGNDNPGFMALHCPVTCGVCKEKCTDRASDCPGWTAQGECFNNAQFMYHKCPSSCGVCEMGQCLDKNETQCAIWHDSGECERNPLAVMKECPKTCGVCTVSCMDQDEGCKGWAAATGGKLCESEEDKAFMLRVCPSSCGICTEMDKDEL